MRTKTSRRRGASRQRLVYVYIYIYIYIETNYLDHTSQPANQPTSQPASPTSQPASQPNPTNPTQPPPTQPASLQGEGECFLPSESDKNRGLPTPTRMSSKVSCFTVVFLRQHATVNLDEKCKFGIQNAILLQRGCEEQIAASVYHCNLPAFSRGRKSHVLPLKNT